MNNPNYISFRDDAARIFLKESIYYRYIFDVYKNEYDHFIKSGLYNELQNKGLIISHIEIEVTDLEKSKNVYKLLKPFQIPFQSYPFEWSYTQWKKALISYIEINKIALKYGMILKDATPYNFSLIGGNSLLIDTSSFSFFKDGDKFNAYHQFCSQFLSPIILMHYNGSQWSKISKTSITGFSLDFISKQLPFKSWFNINVLINIHIHSRFLLKKEDNNHNFKNGFSIEKINLLFDLVLNMINKWGNSNQQEYKWDKYYDDDIETVEYLNDKENFIENCIKKYLPESLLDLGANTGKFSFIASKYINKVIAAESNESCVDIIESKINNEQLSNVFTLTQELTETTPNMGSNLKEINSFINRAKSEMTLALALEHHLYMTKKMSFDHISELFSLVTKKYLITEFIPITDLNLIKLLNDSNKNNSEYNFENYLNSLMKHFKLIEIFDLKGSTRKLILLEKINNSEHN